MVDILESKVVIELAKLSAYNPKVVHIVCRISAIRFENVVGKKPTKANIAGVKRMTGCKEG